MRARNARNAKTFFVRTDGKTTACYSATRVRLKPASASAAAGPGQTGQ